MSILDDIQEATGQYDPDGSSGSGSGGFFPIRGPDGQLGTDDDPVAPVDEDPEDIINPIIGGPDGIVGTPDDPDESEYTTPPDDGSSGGGSSGSGDLPQNIQDIINGGIPNVDFPDLQMPTPPSGGNGSNETPNMPNAEDLWNAITPDLGSGGNNGGNPFEGLIPEGNIIPDPFAGLRKTLLIVGGLFLGYLAISKSGE